jgi:hypothetical protein
VLRLELNVAGPFSSLMSMTRQATASFADGQHADEVRIGPPSREHLRARTGGPFAVHPCGATPGRAARPELFGARTEPRRSRGRNLGDFSDAFSRSWGLDIARYLSVRSKTWRMG